MPGPSRNFNSKFAPENGPKPKRQGSSSNHCFSGATVDGRNPAPVDMVNIPLFTRFYICQVVQDFFHQQYGKLRGCIVGLFLKSSTGVSMEVIVTS